ncbi:MAG: hypothetical protein CMN85_02480 [Spongiibacteraceae bacterium]|nr:hypothetical protein [Spongiibacteraceae bacterium]
MLVFIRFIILGVAAFVVSCGMLPGGGDDSESDAAADERYRSFCIDKAPADSQYFVTGVGVGKDVMAARQFALADIAQKLSSTVSVTTVATTRQLDDYESESFDQDVSIKSNVSVSNAVELCRDDRAPIEQVFVVYQLDKRPLVQKVYADILGSWSGEYAGVVNFKGPTILTGSRFASELQSKLVREGSEQVRTVVVDLQRQNNRWVLSVNDGATYGIDDRSFLSFISPNFGRTVKALDIDIASGQAPERPVEFRFARSVRLRNGDDFNFRIASRRNGYLSLFNIYEDGRIANLIENRPVSGQDVLHYPEGGSFTSLLLEDGRTTYDIYIGVLTETPILLSEFAKLTAEGGYLAGDEHYQFDQFLRWFDFVNPIGVSTLEARTEP